MAFKLSSAEDIFPVPLLRYEVADAAKLNRALLKEIAQRRAAEGGINKSNRKGWHSGEDLFERPEPAHSELAKMLLTMLAQATRHYAPDADFANMELVPDGWINVNPRGGYNAPHDHMGAFWSGCYYVHVPDDEGDAGAIEFLSPHKPLPNLGMIKGPLTADKLRFRPKPGTALIFPSSLVHWVHPNDSEEERVTIAFNARFRRKQPQNPVNRLPGGARPRS